MDLTPPSRHDISTIMYTNGTMGEPEGVLITQKNNVVICINGLDQFLKAQNEVVECNEPKCKFFCNCPSQIHMQPGTTCKMFSMC